MDHRGGSQAGDMYTEILLYALFLADLLLLLFPPLLFLLLPLFELHFHLSKLTYSISCPVPPLLFLPLAPAQDSNPKLKICCRAH